MATDPPHSPASGWRRPICSMCKEAPAVCVGLYAGRGSAAWARCSGCCKETHLTGTCVPIGDEAMEKAARPTFNHTREDGPFNPCPECAALMTPSEREALYRDSIASLVAMVAEHEPEHRCEPGAGFACCTARRILRNTAPAAAPAALPVDNGWTYANHCEACLAKPGSPTLCSLCLRRRALKVGDVLRDRDLLCPGMRVRQEWEFTDPDEVTITGWRDGMTTVDAKGCDFSDDGSMWRGGRLTFLGWIDPKTLKATAVNPAPGPDGKPESAAVAPAAPGRGRAETPATGEAVGLPVADHGRTRLHSGLCCLCGNPDDLCPDERCLSCCSFSHGIHPADPPAPDRFIKAKSPQRRPPGPVELHREVERLEGELRKAVEAWTDAMTVLPAGGQVGRAP
jgi:hypothetical protein